MDSILCPKCRVGSLSLDKETMDDIPENICDYCGSRFRIFLEDEKDDGSGTLRLVEV